MRVLGIDTSLRSTGLGVVESVGSRLKSVEFGVIKTAAARPHSECLSRLDAGLRELIQRTRPEAASIEGIFFCKNVRTAVLLGEARGVAIAACASACIPIFEYSPRRMKQALVGYGAAHKGQVGKMVVRLLALKEEPPEDAADALAMAICHLHAYTGHEALRPESI